jgi:hypothetical protein
MFIWRNKSPLLKKVRGKTLFKKLGVPFQEILITLEEEKADILVGGICSWEGIGCFNALIKEEELCLRNYQVGWDGHPESSGTGLNKRKSSAKHKGKQWDNII